MYRRKGKLHILRHGQFTLGKVTEVKKTNVKVNKQQRYKIHITYDMNGTDFMSSYNGYGDDVRIARQKRESGETIGVLFDPRTPKKTIMADTLVCN
jgi:hypothetical protein